MVKNFIRALRLPFITASILPFTFGSLIHRKDFNVLGFLLGLAAACATHLSANLINDYADSKSFLLSLPFGLLISAILFSNEIPNYDSDVSASKFTLVKLFGKARAFIGYYLLMLLVFFAIALNVAKGYLNISALFSFVLIGLVVKSARLMRNCPNDKLKLVESSKTTINVQIMAGILLIIACLYEEENCDYRRRLRIYLYHRLRINCADYLRYGKVRHKPKTLRDTQ